MSKRNENRPGYKKTKVGWIPKEWGIQRIGELCSFSSGHGFRRQDWTIEGLPIIRIQNLNNSREFNYFDGETDPKWMVFPGDLLFAWAGVKGVSFGPTIWRGPKGVLNQHIYKIHIKNQVDRSWFFLALLRITEIIEKKAHGFKSSLLHIHKGDISEQKKIAEILSTWDAAIQQTRKLIEAKKHLKKALTQQLITKKWQTSHTQIWKILKAQEIFEVRSTRNHSNEPVLSVTQDEGVVLRNSLDRKIEASKTNLYSYKLVEPGDFIISLRSFQGGIEYSEYRGIVSPAYHVIRPKRIIDHSFYKHLFKSQDFIGRLAITVIGIRDGKQVNYGDFSFLNLPFPPLGEQEAIGKFLTKLDYEIQLIKKKLKALVKQKRGLMQKLLTGEVRVKINYNCEQVEDNS
jgi:type I restriction enzyme S subunit